MKRYFGIALTACLLAPALSGANAQTADDSAAQDQIDPSGESDSGAAIEAALAQRHKLVLPCGRFLIAKTVQLPSHSELAGAGACTIIVGAAHLARNPSWDHVYASARQARNLIANADFAAGGSDFSVHDLTLDGSGVAGPAVLHMASFVNASKIKIDHVRFLGSGALPSQDGVNFVSGSANYQVTNSYGYNLPGACVDQWDGTHDFRITGNTCDGHGVGSYGVVVNGLSSGITAGYRANTTYNGVIDDNVVTNMSIGGIGVWGLCNTAQHVCGLVEHVTVARNKISDVARFHGILVGDCNDVTIAGNDIARIGSDGIRIASGSPTSPTHQIVVKDNVVKDANKAAGKSMGIEVGGGPDAPDNVRLEGNRIEGSTHRYAIYVHGDARNVTVRAGKMSPGVDGTLFAPNR